MGANSDHNIVSRRALLRIHQQMKDNQAKIGDNRVQLADND